MLYTHRYFSHDPAYPQGDYLVDPVPAYTLQREKNTADGENGRSETIDGGLVSAVGGCRERSRC